MARSWQAEDIPPGFDDFNADEMPGSSPKEGHSDPQTFACVEDIPRLDAIMAKPITPLCGRADEPVLIEGSITAFTGKSGGGKSSLVHGLATCVAIGIPYAGFPTLQRPVLYLDAENPHTFVMERAARLRLTDGFAAVHYWGLGCEFEPPHPAAGVILEWIARCDPKPVVVVDPVVAFMSRAGMDENSANDVRRFFTDLRKLTSLGATVIPLHHSGKADGNQVRGSSDFPGAVDCGYYVENVGGNPARLEYIRVTAWKSRSATKSPIELRAADVIGGFVNGEEDRGEIQRRTVVSIVRNEPGITARDFDAAARDKNLGRDVARAIRDAMVLKGEIRMEREGKRSVRYYLVG